MPNTDEDKKQNININKPVNLFLKAKYAFYSTLVFFFVANPETFKLTQRAFGKIIDITSSSGVPTALGFTLHSGIFFLLLWTLMLFPATI